MPRKTTLGFTLLELSVVLFIMALIVGGILTGRTMIQNAKLTQTINQMTDIQQAVSNFRDQYHGYPGDLKNAATVLPTINGIAPVSGNGDGYIGTPGYNNIDLDSPGFYGERAQFFTQLGLAGFTQLYDPTSLVPGVGFPAPPLHPATGMIAGTEWGSTTNWSNMSGLVNFAQDPMYLFIGVCKPSALDTDSTYDDCAIFTPLETQQIDTKLDDGLPLSGKILAPSQSTICALGTQVGTSPNPVTNSYDLTSKVPGCNILYSLVNL